MVFFNGSTPFLGGTGGEISDIFEALLDHLGKIA
jgi:hypothetical protein